MVDGTSLRTKFDRLIKLFRVRFEGVLSRLNNCFAVKVRRNLSKLRSFCEMSFRKLPSYITQRSGGGSKIVVFLKSSFVKSVT